MATADIDTFRAALKAYQEAADKLEQLWADKKRSFGRELVDARDEVKRRLRDLDAALDVIRPDEDYR